jgi:endonuclease/exonuclease/phosphatase family metal-dependent hydrolase
MLIKLIQWNVWFKEKPENIADFLKEADADIICAQELIKDSRINLDVAKYVAEKLGFEYYYHVGVTWDNRPDKVAQGNAIFSRYPLDDSHYFYVQQPKHNPIDSSHEGRVYIEVVIKIGDKEVTVGTTHLSNSDQFMITAERKNEIDILSDILKEREDNYIFTGDLNSLPDSYTIFQIDKILSRSGPAYDQKSKKNGLNHRLDYIYNSNDINIIDSKILECPYSDHLPVQIRFKF